MSVTVERHFCSFCLRIAAGAGGGDVSVAFDDLPFVRPPAECQLAKMIWNEALM